MAANRFLQLSHFVIAFLLLLATEPAFAASAPDEPEAQPPAGEDIVSVVVTGQRPGVLRRLMEDFILEIGDPASRSRGYARWRDQLCVGVFNLPDQVVAQYIADRITLTALENGVKTGGLGCDVNLRIVFSPDAPELASNLVEGLPNLFRPFGNTEGTTQGLAALERFKTSDAPVRWWQITMPVDETGLPAIQFPGIDEAPFVRSVASRLKVTTSDAIWGGVIIVDASKLGNIQWPQLADYLTMVSLVQVNPNSRPAGYDSILNLFSADNPPRAMTDMDHTYLRALYEMDTMMVPHAQRGMFSNHMVRVLRKVEDGE